MKKLLFLIVALVSLSSCSKSNEEKANILIKTELRKSLFLPETYKPVETKVDSAFAPLDNPDLYQKLAEVAEFNAQYEALTQEINEAKRSIAIWGGPYQTDFGRQEVAEAKVKKENAEAQQEKVRAKALKAIEETQVLLKQPKKFVGFKAYHNYRANNNGGQTLIGETIFLIDPNFEKVLFHCHADEYKQIQQAIEQFKDELGN